MATGDDPTTARWPPAVADLLAWTSARDRAATTLAERFGAHLASHEALARRPAIVKVAGTNGKGSVCAMLEATLLADGRRVGLFTSPHLVDVTERFRVNGRDAAPDVLDAHARAVRAAAEAVVAARGAAFVPSFFEALVLVALRLFDAEGVDVAVFEAGVGGRNDATSLLPAVASAVTSVGLDHQDQLGPTLEAIAADKAGIAPPGTALVLGRDIPDGPRRVLEDDARRRGLALATARPEALVATLRGAAPTEVRVQVEGAVIECLLPLPGRFQVDNLATVVALARVLHARGVLRDLASLAGVARTRWAGRLEVRPGRPTVVLDVAHNAHGLAALAAALDDLAPYAERSLVYGAAAGKDWRACLPLLADVAPRVYVVEGFHRAEPAATIAAALGAAPAGCFPSPADAVRALRGAAGTVVVAGSVFLVGALRAALVAGAP